MDELELIRIKQWIFDPLNKTLTLEASMEAPDPEDKIETLEAKHALLLHTLVTNQGATLTREKLVSLVWKDRFVDDRTINATVSRLRKMLGGSKDEFIKTHPKVGYSFVPEVYFLEREEVSKQYSTIASQLRYKHYFLYSIILLGLIISLFTFQQVEKATTPKTPLIPASEIAPLTYLKGNNYSPSLSANNKLLAFINQETIDSKRHVLVQSLDTNQTQIVDEQVESGSPFWSQQSQHLYYQAFDKGTCLIRRTTVSLELHIGEVEDIAQCGSMPFFQGISIAPHSNWLYFSFSDSVNSPYYVIKKINLSTKVIENVTTPPVKYKGDFFPKIRNDAKYLAFLRDFDDGSTAIMLKNNETGEVKKLTHVINSSPSFEWSKDQGSILYTNENNVLTAIDINSNEKKPILTHNENISEPLQLSDGKIIASVGEKFLNSIMLKPLVSSDQKLVTAISSAFRDFGASVHIAKQSQIIAFVSNRSGSNQIWISNGNVREKISTFEGMESPKSLRLSPDGSKLIYMYKQQLFIYDIAAKEHLQLPLENQKIKNPIWLCDSSKELMYVSLEHDKWNLQRLNINSLKIEKLYSNVASINSDCGFNNYFVSLMDKPGLYQLDIEGNVALSLPILSDRQFVHWDYWASYKNNIYFLDYRDKLMSYSIEIQAFEEVDIGDLSTNSIKIEDGHLILDSFDINNTFIGQITTL